MSDRIDALENEVRELTQRLLTSQEQTAQAIANTDRAIAQTAEALEQAQRFLLMLKERSHGDKSE